MTERTFNYPKHPLFGIAPLLHRGFQTVQYDEYATHLVGRIRAGRYTSELWDCNGLYLDYSDRVGHAAYRQHVALPSRHKLTPEQLAEYRARVNDPALAAERKK